ncbi:MAG TPA: dihydrodipicolinate reductase C-terminal domain-containing protein [Terriglobales bacterium]|jgi:4-hydroxy-tetrahydrodipicolinate reductase|nr:dihydrodipicolinate reductase C-terminal domain-containing protein [Terriglobales bacterium]
MILIILGRGKTGTLVAEVARQRGHEARVLGGADNRNAAGLTPQTLRDVAVVIDFTTPQAVLDNIAACVHARKNIVVGTTGWYDQLPRIREVVAQSGIGLLYASNFSVGVNVFFEIARAAAAALHHGYAGEIMERHHAQKKDAPSGTALTLQKILRQDGGQELEIVSLREGETVGLHEIVLDSRHDTIRLAHDGKSRRGFAEGAVRAAEWLAGRSGFFDFRQVWRELR